MRDDTLPAPRLGQQTREVLGELGYAEDQIARMVEAGAAIDRHSTKTV